MTSSFECAPTLPDRERERKSVGGAGGSSRRDPWHDPPEGATEIAMGLLRITTTAAAAVALLTPPAFGQTSNPGLPRHGADTQRARLPRPRIRIQGRVVMGDGRPAPVNVPVQRVCGNDRPVTQAHTDSEGRFGFEVGEITGVTPDATQEWASAEPGRAGAELGHTPGLLDRDHADRIAARSLAGCSLQAALAGFRSSVVPIGLRDTFDDPEVGIIVLEPRHAARGLPISIGSLRAPERARDAYERGLRELLEGDAKRAREELERSVREFPDHAQAWNANGEIHEKEGNTSEAREAFERAAAADATYLTPWVGLVRLDAHEAKWADVLLGSERVLAANGEDFPEVYFYDAVASFSVGEHRRAELSAREAVQRGMQARFPQVLHLLGLALASQQKFEEAALHLKSFLDLESDSPAAAAARQQLAAVEAAAAGPREAQR